MGGGGGGAGGGGGGGSGALSWLGVTDGLWSRERASGLAQDAKMPIKMQAIAVVPSRSFVTHFPHRAICSAQRGWPIAAKMRRNRR
jgi:hypothetical protein